MRKRKRNKNMIKKKHNNNVKCLRAPSSNAYIIIIVHRALAETDLKRTETDDERERERAGERGIKFHPLQDKAGESTGKPVATVVRGRCTLYTNLQYIINSRSQDTGEKGSGFPSSGDFVNCCCP